MWDREWSMNTGLVTFFYRREVVGISITTPIDELYATCCAFMIGKAREISFTRARYSW
jgi:hypothetical protein